MTPLRKQELAPWGTVDTTVLTPEHQGAEPVFLHFTSETLPGVIVAYGSPIVVLVAQPVCGCDACDDGSDVLIEAIDEAFESVVLGAVVIEQDKRSTRVGTLHGEATSSSLSPDHDRVIGRWSGGPWLD